MAFIITELVYIFVWGPVEGRLRVLEFLAALKTCWWPLTVVFSVVWLLSLWHIPRFHSQFYTLWILVGCQLLKGRCSLSIIWCPHMESLRNNWHQQVQLVFPKIALILTIVCKEMILSLHLGDILRGMGMKKGGLNCSTWYRMC